MHLCSRNACKKSRSIIEETSRDTAERHLAQLEEALAGLCSSNVAQAAIQLIAERSNHIPPYTPLRFVGNAAKKYKKDLATVTPEERRELKIFSKASDEAAGRDYAIATEVVREFYGSLTQFLTRIIHELDSHNYVGTGAWRVLESYHPNLRFHQVKMKRKHAR
jgi:hypothetical protein